MTRAPVLAVILAAGALAAGLAMRSDDGMKVRVDLPSANGLRSGSPVRMGGVKVGKIDALRITKNDTPQAVVRLDDRIDLASDARAEIVTSNLLGAKYLQLYPGRAGTPLAHGGRIPESRVLVPTDLDQVLNSVTPAVRARLRILINEAGTWMTGRSVDFNRALELLPQDLDAGSVLLDRMLDQNQSLRRLVASSSSLVSRLAPERAELAGFVEAAGRATSVTATRRQDLRRTLASAPDALRSLTSALTELQRTAIPLGPAARNLSAAAPPLRRTLDALPEFERNARPTLKTLREVAPRLTALGKRATPVLQRADPAVRSLSTAVRNAAPVTNALDVSIDDVLGLVEGWARSIPNRDSVSHLFRGRASVGAESMRSLLSRLPSASKKRDGAKAKTKLPTLAPKPAAPVRVPGTGKLDNTLEPVRKAIDDALGVVQGTVGGVLDRGLKKPDVPGRDQDMTALLDFLLGD